MGIVRVVAAACRPSRRAARVVEWRTRKFKHRRRQLAQRQSVTRDDEYATIALARARRHAADEATRTRDVADERIAVPADAGVEREGWIEGDWARG